MPDRVTITKRDLLLTFRDGSTFSQTVFMEDGSLSWDEGTPEAIYFMDRGSIEDGDTRDGDDSPLSLSFTVAQTDHANATSATLDGWLRYPDGSWERTNLVSTLGAGRDFRVHLDVTILGDKRGQADRTLRFPHAKLKVSASEGDFLTVSVNGTCKATQPEEV